ncbi:DotU family type IV/VI secretion system protein [Enterobacter bugandensis]|jgi:type VI secretion system protein ImpK|uniref:type VI secretion system protein TssL, short form n=1 Tax=Enterobacter TaxID=547 RepID=UPI000643884F|nr:MULTISPECIES: type VI secretion system protein TssL, short form [Enterobacter]KLQ28923.1 membrane protein [Enterobacter bugandensis]MBE3492790.1 DotU family type IV/VI secretion system protein [Enterobacter cloacae complex sp. P12RS]MBF2746976.1 DotU family type IV/VI secretion system protein [Enterobacter bugandensis]MBF2799621.1 DotU family type IV/VI secretion system protein [Enterobacter bugandensis]
MRNDIDIDELMAETWLTVTLLKQGATTPDGDVLYDTCCKHVESVREALDRAGYDEASIGHISYAQCALLDEVVMSRKPGESSDVEAGQAAWRKAPLQARHFGSLYAGEALWDRIAEVLRQPAPNMAVLTCYHRVIALGFRGLYSMSSVSQSQREEVIKALAERVPPLDAGISLVVRRTGKHRSSLLRSVWFWIAAVVVVTGIVWWGGHLWLQALLSGQLPELPR